MKFDRKFVLLAFVSLLLLSATLGTSFITQAAYEQTTNSYSIDPFPQAGKFYTLVGRTIGWEIVDGKNIRYHEQNIIKWSVQDVVGDVAIVNRTFLFMRICPETGENHTNTLDKDYEIATNRTILSVHLKAMSFTTTGFQWSGETPLDEDVGEHAWAWFPTDLYIGALVPVSWTGNSPFLGDMLEEVVDEDVIQVVGVKQDCWMLRMPPSITIDGTGVLTETYWVDKDMGVPLKISAKGWALDGSWGNEVEFVLAHTNIDLGPESTQPPSPTYTLTAPTTPGFPEAGKFYTYYLLAEDWYIKGATNVTWYNEGLWSWWVVNVTDGEALVYRISWLERLCKAEGVGELEYVEIDYLAYRINVTTREILDATGARYDVNMTSLTYKGPWDWTPLLANDIGEKTYCWLPTNLYIGANVDISCTTDLTLDNATYTVIDEEIISALGEPQGCWVLYLPPTASIDGTWNYSEAYYSDMDVGIPLYVFNKGEAVDGSSASVVTVWLIDTNVDLGPEASFPSIEISLTTPAAVDVSEGKTFWVNCTVTNTGDLNATGVYITIDLPSGLTLVSGSTNKTLGTITAHDSQAVAWQVRGDEQGTYAVAVNATSENAGSDSTTVSVTVKDTTKPEVSITAPAEGAQLRGTVTIQFTATDAHLNTVLLYIDSAVFNVTGETSYEWNTTKVGDGLHTIKIVATDEAGNTGEDQITVTTTNVQKAREESYTTGTEEGYETGKEEGYASGRDFGLIIGTPIGLIVGAIIAIAIVIAKKRF